MVRKVKKSPTKVIRRGRSSTSRISSKNQITIPVEILRAVNIEIGDVVRFTEDGKGRIVVEKIDEPEWKSALRELIGSEPNFGKDFDYKKEREEWDARLTRRG